MALREFGRAARDAQHTLAVMDYAHKISPCEEWNLSHEQHRPLVLFHLAQASALQQLAKNGPEAAIARLARGADAIKELAEFHRAAYHSSEPRGSDELVARLEELGDAVRGQYSVDPTLEDKLSDAVAVEDYEKAAQLRDEMDRRRSS